MQTRPIVFVHGNFVTRRCWDAWVARYESLGLECHAIAYPGRDRPIPALRADREDPGLESLTLDRVLDHHLDAIRRLEETPIVIGHSFGGLLTQLLVQRGAAAAAVAIDSVPPQGVLAPSWSFVRSTWPVLNPLAGGRNYYMPFSHFRYTFANDLPAEAQRAAYDAHVVPESRRLARGGLSKAAKIDFRRPHAPLLLIAGGRDHIMPAAVNRANFRRYEKAAARSGSRVDFREFPELAHYSVIGGPGWEQVADYALEWALGVTEGSLAA